jgi:hypothetical protein
LADRYYIKARYRSCSNVCELMIAALLLTLLLCSAGNAWAQTVVRHLPRPYAETGPSGRTVIELEIVVPPADTKAATITALTGSAYGARPGEPLLAYSFVRLLLPPDADMDSLQAALTDADWQDLPGQYEIPPAPPAATWDSGKYLFDWAQKDQSLIVAGRDTSVYNKDEFFPKQPVEVVSVGQFRQLKFASLRIWTSAYNPVQKRLRILTGATAEVSVDPAPGSARRANPVHASDFVPNLFSNTLNADDYDKFYTPQAPAAGPTADYVIITTSTIRDTSAKLAAFIVCKENCSHTVKVVTEAPSADDTHYASGSSADQRADNIRDWLQSHLSDGIEYVLLIGDPDPTSFTSSTSIPMKMCYPRHGAVDGYEEAPTDMFFAELTATWDYDGDGYCGEYNGDYCAGGADKNCEIRVGRIPFYGSYPDLDSILQKTIDYSSETGDRSWRDKVLIAAAISNFSPQDDDGDGTADFPLLTPDDRTFEADWGQEIKSLASSEGFGSYTLYEKEGVYSNGSAYSLTAYDSPLTVSNFVSEWQNNYGFVTWSAHGTETVAYRFCWTSDSDYPNVTGNHPAHDETIWYTLFSTSYCSQLDDTHPSFVVQASCLNASPENTNNLAYRLLKNGAIGTFAGTSITWYAIGSWSTSIGPSHGDDTSYGYYIFSQMAQDDTAAAALNWCRTNFGTGWASSSWMNMIAINLYGDPGLSLVTACNPSSPPTAHDCNVPAGMNLPVSIELQATDDGLPNPPAALSYIITSLPSHGTLTDPDAGPIETVEYELLNNDNQVVYTPQRGYLGPDQFTFIANDGGQQPIGGDSNIATVSISVVEYFTELFDSQDNDLENRMFTFIPDGSPCFYMLCRDNAAQFPTDPNGGILLSLSDDDYLQLSLTDAKQVGIYGYTFGSFHLGSNGYITFDSNDTDGTEAPADHFALKRISALFDDLDPSAGGTVTWKQLPDRAAVTFENVPEAGDANSTNSFQIEMFFQGTIRLTYLNIDAADGLAGLSDGNSLPTDFIETDLSSFPLCADFNDDNKVNIADFALLAARWLNNTCANSIWCDGADLDRSNQVDIPDIDNLTSYWLIGDYPIQIEDTFTSIALQDGRVYDIDGDGTGDGANSTDATTEALRLGDWSANESYRSIVSFDTSSMPPDATILSANLQLTCGKEQGISPFDWPATCNIDIASPSFGAVALEDSDYQAVANANAVASFNQNPIVGQTITSTEFNAQGCSNINTDATTQLRIYFTTPTNSNGIKDYLGFYSGKATNPINHPKLIVRYTTFTPTLTFYSAASADGRVYDDGTGIAGAGSDTGNSGDNSLRLGDYSGGQSYRTILSFDTSSIPAHYKIESARLEMIRGAESGQNPFDWPATCNIDIANPSFGAVALEDSDWQAVGDAVAVASFTADPGTENPMTSTDFDSAGLANINRNGTTQFKVYFTPLQNNDAIADYLGFYSGEAVITKQPKLIIECSIN